MLYIRLNSVILAKLYICLKKFIEYMQIIYLEFSNFKIPKFQTHKLQILTSPLIVIITSKLAIIPTPLAMFSVRYQKRRNIVTSKMKVDNFIHLMILSKLNIRTLIKSTFN